MYPAQSQAFLCQVSQTASASHKSRLQPSLQSGLTGLGRVFLEEELHRQSPSG